jgi:hypothetical protein
MRGGFVRDIWYADHRDLVKWGSLVQIATRDGLKTIIQIPFLRADPRPTLSFASSGVEEEFEIPEMVWTFFRSVPDIEQLGQRSGLQVKLLSQWFEPRRRAGYVAAAVDFVQRTSGTKVVLLDPDTGIARTPKAEHAAVQDARQVWRALGRGDSLVLYQHTLRTLDWCDTSRELFGEACQIDRVETVSCQRFPGVVFHVAKKV